MTDFGPWQPGLDTAELRARLRAWQALALVFARDHPALLAALRAAEHDRGQLHHARHLLQHVPTLWRRRMLATYADLVKPNHEQT